MQGSGWVAPDLTAASASEIFTLYGAMLRELRARDVIRTNNAPAGDYAEWLVAGALHGTLAPNSEKSFDVGDTEFGRVQVKVRVVSSPAQSGQLQTSPFRSSDFDHAAFVLLSDVDYTVFRAFLLPVEAVQERWTWRAHVKGHVVQMNGPTMNHTEAIDITDELRQAAWRL